MLTRLSLVLCVLLASAANTSAQSASTWFLAEGANNAIFTQEILVANPGASTLDVTVTLLPQADAIVGGTTTKVFALAPTARLTVSLTTDFGLNGSASARVSAVLAGPTPTPADIVVERSMYFPGASRQGGHNASGVTGLAPSWTLAEGATTIFDTFVLAANPNPTDTLVRATYLTATGQEFVSQQDASANSRVTFWPGQEHPALAAAEFSTVVDSLTAGNDIVAERAMYFDLDPTTFARSGHAALGVPTPSTTWYFAEGVTGGNAQIAFETFLLLANPGTTAATATVDYLLDSGQVVTLTYALKPRERLTVWVDQEGRETPDAGALVNAAFGMRVTASAPIVAERSLYWGPPSAADPLTPRLPWSDGHATAGVTALAARWAFAEGGQDFITSSSLRFQTFLLVSNPNPNPVLVRATFFREDGTGIQRDRCVAGSSRANFWTADFPELSNRRFSSVVESVASGAQGACGVPTIGGEEFVAERAMYWGDAFAGGHANVGVPWSTPVGIPVIPVDPLSATLHGLVTTPGVREGRLSGGEWVSLTIANAAIGDTEVWFGNRRSPDVVFMSATQLRARTPVRTVATGFGSGGPAPVEVRSASRTASAGTFTYTFRVLAFGDSITWGTTSQSMGGTLWTSTRATPYPRRLKSALTSMARFGTHVRVTNAGWPAEQARGDGEIRMPRCLVTDAGPNCIHRNPNFSTEPDDYVRPFDVVVILHGVNDLFWGTDPAFVRNALRNMVLAAKAPPFGDPAVPVLMTRLSSYKPRPDGSLIPGIEKVPELNTLIWELTVEQSLQRLDFGDTIAMSVDGLHPSQAGYDRMAQLVLDKLLDMFPQ